VRAKLGGEYLTSDHLAGQLSAEWLRSWACAQESHSGGAFDAHWDAIGSNIAKATW